MIDEFNLLLEGKFENKRQAFRNPSRFAYIRVTHVSIGDGLFYGEQAYNHNLRSPYRQFVLEPVEITSDLVDAIQLNNYELLNPENHKGFKDLDNITRDMLKLKPGCAVVMTKVKNNHFAGGIQGKGCDVMWGEKETYLTNNVQLTYDLYKVEDKGIDPLTKKQVWGSQYGPFEFRRMPE